MYLIYCFINNLNEEQTHILYDYMQHKQNMNIRIQHMIKDILYYKIHEQHNDDNDTNKNKHQTLPNLRMKIPFISKGIELLKLENIINSDKLRKTLPNNFKIHKPCLLYKHDPPIRNKISIMMIH